MRFRILVLLIPLGTLTACPRPGEAVRHSVLEACVRVPSATERVFRTAAEWDAFVAANRGTSPPVDFTTSMVAAHFEGEGSACVGFDLLSVEETDEEVVVEATLFQSPGPCVAVIAYPQLVIALEQRPQNVRFEIVRLGERASTATRSCF